VPNFDLIRKEVRQAFRRKVAVTEADLREALEFAEELELKAIAIREQVEEEEIKRAARPPEASHAVN